VTIQYLLAAQWLQATGDEAASQKLYQKASAREREML
jgi:hypothetical protein